MNDQPDLSPKIGMNFQLIQRLILKDWYLQRIPILASLLLTAGAIAIVLLGGEAGFILGTIALVTVLIGVGANLAIATIVNERKEQTLPFIMTLPISYREYTTAKILANLLIFLVPWTAVTIGSVIALYFTQARLLGLIPFVLIMAVEMLVSTCLVATVAITTESQNWTIAVLMAGNLALNVFGYWVAHLPSFSSQMFRRTPHWTPQAIGMLLAELATVAILLILSFVIQSRKKDFV